MKGVILAGGKATRLRPLTWVANKHLLPIYNKPMIFFPLASMRQAGIEEVLIITGPEYAGSFMNLLKSGKDFGLRLSYEIQEEAGGLAQAVQVAQDFAGGEKLLVILGDNIFNHNLSETVVQFEKQEKGAKIFAKRMSTDSKQYGVVEMDEKTGKVISIEEKPEHPKSDLAQTGIYLYDEQVFSFIKTLKPSGRGELEITDLNNCYLKHGSLKCEVIDGWWIDAGASYDELLRANNLLAELVKSGELT